MQFSQKLHLMTNNDWNSITSYKIASRATGFLHIFFAVLVLHYSEVFGIIQRAMPSCFRWPLSSKISDLVLYKRKIDDFATPYTNVSQFENGSHIENSSADYLS